MVNVFNKRIAVISSFISLALYSWIESHKTMKGIFFFPPPVKPSGPALLFFGSFLVTDSVSLQVVSLFKFSISSCFSFGNLYVFRNLPISSRLSSLLVYSFS